MSYEQLKDQAQFKAEKWWMHLDPDYRLVIAGDRGVNDYTVEEIVWLYVIHTARMLKLS